jgi:methyltransferase
MRGALILIAVFVPMLIEAGRASLNERAQLARGGIEPADDVYKLMRVAYPAAFLAMIVEGMLRGGPPRAVLVSGAVVFTIAKALKWWAILTLGPFWTFRVVVVPGARLVAGGPYRWLRHPNYVGVVGELIGVGLMTGAWVFFPLGTAGFVSLLSKRIAVESRMLESAAHGVQSWPPGQGEGRNQLENRQI